MAIQPVPDETLAELSTALFVERLRHLQLGGQQGTAIRVSQGFVPGQLHLRMDGFEMDAYDLARASDAYDRDNRRILLERKAISTGVINILPIGPRKEPYSLGWYICPEEPLM